MQAHRERLGVAARPRLVGLAALVGTILVATFGSETSATNPAPTRLFVWLWVGIVPLSLR
jgi:hypothetical protein